MRLLITGGSGFIGSNFVRFMLNKYPDYEIINLDKLTYAGNLNNLKDIVKNKNYKFIKGDICNKQIIEKIIKNIDVVINFAAETHVDRSIIDAGSFVLTDMFGTYRLLEAVKKFNIHKFIQISTDEVYGSIIEGSFTEESYLNPSNPYAASKSGADLLVRSFFTTYGIPTIITRSTNNFGPFQHPEKMIPKFIINAILGKSLPLYGNGLNVRDWIYVLDNCEAISLILHKGKKGEIYNVRGDNEITNLELTKMILKILNKPESLIEFVRDRPGHDRRYSLNCKKIKKLGWSSKYKFSEALRETVNWYNENKWWWKPLLKNELNFHNKFCF